MVTIALASRRSGKQHPKGTRATKSVGAAWLVTLWGSSSTAVGTTAMAYSSATRSRVSHHGVPAFAARLSSLRQGTMLGGSGRSWSGLEAEKSTGGAIINAPLGRSLVSPAMSLSNQRLGRADTKREDSSLLVVPSRGCFDWKEGCMSSRAGARRDLSSGADQRSLGATSRYIYAVCFYGSHSSMKSRARHPPCLSLLYRSITVNKEMSRSVSTTRLSFLLELLTRPLRGVTTRECRSSTNTQQPLPCLPPKDEYVRVKLRGDI